MFQKIFPLLCVLNSRSNDEILEDLMQTKTAGSAHFSEEWGAELNRELNFCVLKFELVLQTLN